MHIASCASLLKKNTSQLGKPQLPKDGNLRVVVPSTRAGTLRQKKFLFPTCFSSSACLPLLHRPLHTARNHVGDLRKRHGAFTLIRDDIHANTVSPPPAERRLAPAPATCSMCWPFIPPPPVSGLCQPASAPAVPPTGRVLSCARRTCRDVAVHSQQPHNVCAAPPARQPLCRIAPVHPRARQRRDAAAVSLDRDCARPALSAGVSQEPWAAGSHLDGAQGRGAGFAVSREGIEDWSLCGWEGVDCECMHLLTVPGTYRWSIQIPYRQSTHRHTHRYTHTDTFNDPTTIPFLFSCSCFPPLAARRYYTLLDCNTCYSPQGVPLYIDR